jgi:hypothetical protein
VAAEAEEFTMELEEERVDIEQIVIQYQVKTK